MEKLPNLHPGEILSDEFSVPIDITPYRLAKDIGIPQSRIAQIINGQRRITADTAIRLSRFFGNSDKFWMGIQDDYDVRTTFEEKKDEFENIKQLVLSSLVVDTEVTASLKPKRGIGSKSRSVY